ncbi:YetF domain-containing protein [Parasphingorhabdus sp. JC815]|uniref:DUF421 domain-containing protein n=1 Tax=Parasphingorhabdus sp. JC815 TaxID=3232140 RepID=UPI00345B0CC6
MFSGDAQIDLFLRILLLGPVALLWVVLNVRLIGLRSFSKMAAFDFVVTIATGSLLANAVTVEKWTSFIQSIGAISALLGSQYLVAKMRIHFPQLFRWLANEPVVLMKNGQFLDENLKITRVTRSDVYGKLREANALNLSKVHAVVLETTGDISVLHGDKADQAILPE